MQVMDISTIPNQSFVTTQDGNRYEIRIVECNGAMACDVTMNGVVLFTGMIMKLSAPLIPYNYMMGQNGNFFIVSNTDDEPYWSFFGNTQIIVYASYDEIFPT